MKEQLEQYVKRVKARHQDCRDNEQATKQALIAPLFAILGYDMADPSECKPEYRTDFGKGEKAATPVDWAFLIDGTFAFFVEAKEVGAKITKYAEQLGMYFAKEPAVKLGILTNGVEWKFFTDLDNLNVMDREPFLTWNVLEDESIPVDFLTLLQKSQFKQQLVRTFAERKRHQSLLVDELTRLLAPSPEFVRLAVEKIETRKLTPKVIEQWTPILTNAIQEWAKRYTLATALQRPTVTPAPPPAAKSKRGPGGIALADLIAAGILTPPVKLFRRYKGKTLEASVLADGSVEFQQQRYDTSSGAAEAARATIAGRQMTTNGWTFWRYQGADGKKHKLSDARHQVAHPTGAGASGQKGPQDRAERYGLRKRFWEGLLARPKVKGTRHADLSATDTGWIGAGSGVRGLPFVYVIGQDEGRVELYIDRGAGNDAANKAIYDKLLALKDDIEKEFGAGLTWQRLDDKRACRIAHTLTGGGYRSDQSKWPAIQDAMIDAMGRLEKALAPHLG
ncbi:MAG: DUF4268 domain-containing protein [Planctomycetes bacterium]|nr:DUF4268 domain-containing protein [Planctomycetota bacterium]